MKKEKGPLFWCFVLLVALAAIHVTGYVVVAWIVTHSTDPTVARMILEGYGRLTDSTMETLKSFFSLVSVHLKHRA